MWALPFVLISFLASTTTPALAVPVEARNASDLPPTGNPFGCSPGTKFIRQPVYHGNSNGTTLSSGNSTFLQQYEIDTTHFKPGGPIFFWQGDEGSIQCLNFLQMHTWAEEFGALLVSIEHRYFGISIPFGLQWEDNAEWPTHLLEPLTLENTQMDSVKLVEMIKSTVPGAKESKVISFGGSYGAILSTLNRVNYPDVFFGSISTAAPIHFVSDPSSPDAYIWGDYLSQVYSDHSAEAAAKIKKGMQCLHSKLDKGEFSSLKDSLGLCTAPNSTTQTDWLLFAMLYSYSNVAQFSYNYPVLYGKPIDGLQYLIEETIKVPDAADPLACLKPAALLQAASTGSKCLDWVPTRVVAKNLGLPFEYIWCKTIPYALPQSSENSIFGLVDVSGNHSRINDAMCQRGFGINSIEAGPAYEKQLGLDVETLTDTGRIVFWYGGNDPVTSIGAIRDFGFMLNPTGNRSATQAIYATAAGHTQEQLLSLANDTDALNTTRHFERQSIKSWLEMV